MRRRLGLDRWLLALALTASLLAPAERGRAEDAKAPAEKPAAAEPGAKAPGAEKATVGDTENEADEQRLDAEDEKRREKREKQEQEQQKKWRAKSKEDAKEAEAQQVRTIGRRTGRFLLKAREFMMESKYDESNEVLSRLNPKRLNPYERAQVYRVQGYNAFGKQDVPTAIRLLHQAIDENILTKQDVSDILFQIAQMQMGKDHFEDAIGTLKEWFAQAEKPGAAAYFALALAYQMRI
jgi:hypothetical protein